MVKIEAEFSPVQDLHGYEAPWPPGGGKNKLPFTGENTTKSGITWSADSNGVVTSSGKATSNSQFNYYVQAALPALVPGQSYIISGCPSGGTPDTYYLRFLQYDSNGTLISGSTYIGTDTGSGGTFTVSQNMATALVFCVVLNGQIAPSEKWYPMIRLASVSDPTWSPYSNISPISGWTGATVNRTGKNLFDPTTIITGKFVRAGNVSASNPLGTETSNAAFNCSGYVRVKPSTHYVTELPGYTEAAAAGLVFFGAQTVESAISGVPTNAQGSNKYAFTTPANCNYIRFSWSNNAGLDPNYPYPQLEESTTPTDYEPYSGTSVTLTFGQTVYGGTATDNGDGSWTVVADRAEADLGNFTWTSEDSYFPGMARSDNSVANLGAVYNQTPICSALEGVTPKGYAQMIEGTVCFSNSAATPLIRVRSASYSGLTNAQIKDALTGVKLVYELATPITFTVTAEHLTALVGVNTVWADTNEDTTIEVYGTPIT